MRQAGNPDVLRVEAHGFGNLSAEGGSARSGNK